MRIVEERNPSALARLRDEWRALQAACPDATPYQTWEWNAVWWQHFGSRKRPVLLCLRDDNGLLVGLAPLYTSWHLGLPLRRLAWMGTGPSDYLGPLLHPEYRAQAAPALLAYIARNLRGWDMADLQQIQADSSLLSAECRVQSAEWQSAKSRTSASNELQSNDGNVPSALCTLHSALVTMEPCPFVALPDNWEAFTKRLGKKMRSNLGYYERLLGKTFDKVEYLLADESNLDEGMTALFELHQKRWNARWLPGVLGNKKVQAFHREIAARFLAEGWLRLHLIRIDGQIRSALYCFAWQNRTLYYLGGFAPELGKYSLGTILTARAIRQAIAEGHTEFDFLRGNEPYKYRWLPEERVNQRLLLLRSREGLGGLGELPGRAGFMLNRVERYVEHRAKAFAEQQGRKTGREEKSAGEPETNVKPDTVTKAESASASPAPRTPPLSE